MGSLAIPTSGTVYVDAQSLIYTVEVHPVYGPLLEPLWQAVQAGSVEAHSSEMSLLETLVGPYKKGDVPLTQRYEQFLLQPGMSLGPISPDILREAARLRATTKLRTPDAIHAATALQTGCALFVTNDKGFKSVPNLPLVVLDDLLP